MKEVIPTVGHTSCINRPVSEVIQFPISRQTRLKPLQTVSLQKIIRRCVSSKINYAKLSMID